MFLQDKWKKKHCLKRSTFISCLPSSDYLCDTVFMCDCFHHVLQGQHRCALDLSVDVFALGTCSQQLYQRNMVPQRAVVLHPFPRLCHQFHHGVKWRAIVVEDNHIIARTCELMENKRCHLTRHQLNGHFLEFIIYLPIIQCKTSQNEYYKMLKKKKKKTHYTKQIYPKISMQHKKK